jgi:sec-independent protein translocase protein TatA
MGGFSLWHILLLALLVMLLFGGKRFSAMMGDVAAGLKNFKAGMAEDDGVKARGEEDRRRLGQSDNPWDARPHVRSAERRETPPSHDPRV